MPGRDGTGPMGQGSMTGRGMGYCADNGNNGATAEVRPFWGRGRGRGFGYRCFAAGYPGRQSGYFYGRRRYFNSNSYNSYTVEQEKQILKNEMEFIKNRLEKIDSGTKQ